MLCVTTMTVRPSSASARSIIIIPCSLPGSSPEVGSSRNRSDGFVTSSIATATRRRWPPESRLDDQVRGHRGDAELIEQLRDLSARSALADVTGKAQLGGVVQRLADRQLPVQDVLLGYEAEAQAQLVVVLVEITPVVEDVARMAGESRSERSAASTCRRRRVRQRPGTSARRG